jgi:hypothetical protein
MWMAIGLGLAVPAGARAQAPSNDVAATALFDEGRKLMAAHDYASACPKLAESQRLAPSGGTLLNLAECYEKNGQTASAWAAWKDAAGRANAAGKADVEKRASDRAAALEPSLAKLTVTLAAGSDVAGLEVKRDGVAVGHAEIGIALPVDPGQHTVEASAPGKQPWSGTVAVAAKQKDASVTVTLIDAAAPPPPPLPVATPAPGPNPPPPPPPPPQTETSSWSTQKTFAVIAGGVGVAGIAVGSVFGVVAMSKNNEALQSQNCRTASLCTQNGLSLTSDAKNAANLSTVGFIVGGVALAAGVVLWITAPSPSGSPQTGVRLAPAVGPSLGGFALDATF